MNCKHFGVCGGCKLQNMEYEEQLEAKEQLVRELFGNIRPIKGCKSSWGWRNKMEFSFSQNKEGMRFLGLMMRKGRGRVVQLQECLLVSDWFIHTLENVYAWWEKTNLEAYFPPANRGHLRTLMLREGINTGEKMVVLGVMGDCKIEGFAEAVGEAESIIIRRQYAQKGVETTFKEELIQGRDYITEKLFDFPLKLRAPAFFQPNTIQAEVIYDLALQDLEQVDLLLDLYCGIGCIGMRAAAKARKVIGIELCPEACSAARENIERAGITNMQIMEGDVEACLEQLPSPDCIILDPPRVGISKKSLQKILQLGAKKIIYISCNPLSQKKNIDDMEGYRVEWVQPVDQFPHTTHVENIVYLVKNV